MRNAHKISMIIAVSIVVLLSGAVFAIDFDGGAKIKVGYVITDEQNDLNLNQETFNTYEGFALSLQDIQIVTNNGYNFYGDFSNVTLNNRNMNFTASRLGLLKLSFYNNQYRRTYNKGGSQFTRRESTGLNGEFTPYDNVKFFGGFYYIDKDGTQLSVYRPVYDSLEYTTDYTQYSWNAGLTYKFKKTYVSGEYRNIIFQDDTDFSLDREADQFKMNFFTFLPTERKIVLSGGFLYRKDFMNERVHELKTTTYWGGAKAYFKDNIKLDYRLVASKAEHSTDLNESNIYHHTISVTKSWEGYSGLRLGYDYRSYDDNFEKSTSNGVLFNGWYKIAKWTFKGNFSQINKSDDKGRTLIGDQQHSKYAFSASMKDNRYGGINGKIEKILKEYDDLDAKADYTSSSIKYYYKYDKLGKIVVTYSYVLGEFENSLSELDFEFNDNLVSVYIYPNIYRKIEVVAGATYYRSERDYDLEKFNFTGKISYEFMDDYIISGKYKGYTYDDLLIASTTYTANIIEINLIKKLSF